MTTAVSVFTPILTPRETRILGFWFYDRMERYEIAVRERVAPADVARLIEWSLMKLLIAGFPVAGRLPASAMYLDPDELDRLPARGGSDDATAD